MPTRLRLPLQFLAAVLTTAVLASLWESHRNMAAIAALGHAPDAATYLATMAHDLLGFGPVFAGLGGVALLLGFLVAAWLARALPALRGLLYVVAGGSAIGTMLLLMDLAFGITVVASARDAIGFSGLVACGAVGGLIFVLLRRPALQR